MKPVEIRTLNESDLPAVTALQQNYARRYPGVAVIPGPVYLSPGFHGGQDVFCAVDPGGQLLAYAPLYAVLVSGPPQLPHVLWTEIKADPDVENPQPVKDLLLEQVLSRARQITSGLPARPARLSFEYLPVEEDSIAYVLSRGFHYTESIFSMRRRLEGTIPEAAPLSGLQIRRWKMESEAEQRQYVAARNEAFPDAPTTLEDWQYFMRSPQWARGAALAAFDGEQLAGSVIAYWDETGEPAHQTGYTEYVFVRPAWQGRGIASRLLVEALRYLQEHGLSEAHLAVRAANERALDVYRRLGYEGMGESRLYEMNL